MPWRLGSVSGLGNFYPSASQECRANNRFKPTAQLPSWLSTCCRVVRASALKRPSARPVFGWPYLPAVQICWRFELELVGGERADSSADSGVSPKHCHQDQAAEAVCAIQMSNRCLACWAPCAWTAVLMVVVDALALALEGMRTVAGYSLSGERIFLISISYLAAGLGMAESG